ncbi:MAG: translation initiation factor IF-2 associated domain-containing protein, partial [Alphaproteobacteria bacterium]
MSDQNDNDRPARAPLTLKPRTGSVSSGVVKQSFSHGRSKTVVVETKRRRFDAPVVNLAGPSPAERKPAPAPVERAAPTPPGGLSQEEMLRRQRVAAEFAKQQS